MSTRNAPRESVADMPRRTAHALHALLACARDIGGPVIASEVVLYDSEALSARGTAQALRAGARRGLCFCIKGTWWTTNQLYDLERELEDRYLRDTENEDERTERELEDADLAECVFCNERKPVHEFHDGLRCDACAEKQDG